MGFSALVFSTITNHAFAWESKPVKDDPLVRMPGTQPGQVEDLESDKQCLSCHAGGLYEMEKWQGSLMAQASRDRIFWAGLTVAAQDAIWQLWEHDKDVPGATPVLMTNTLVQLDVSDIDGDGIPAYWEELYFGGTTDAVASVDSDLDGINNLGKYIAFTLPNDSNSVFTFSAEFYPTGSLTEVEAEFDALRSRDYALEEPTNLTMSTSSWINVSGYVRGIDGEMDILRTNSTGTGMYRVKAKLPGTL